MLFVAQCAQWRRPANHSFSETFGPNGGGTPTVSLSEVIESELGGLDAVKSAFADAGATRFKFSGTSP